METDTMTISSQSFWLNKHGVFALSIVSAFSVNSKAQDLSEVTMGSCFAVITELSSTETFNTDKIYSFPTKKNFRERYKRIAQSEWFKKTHSSMSIGEIMTIEE